MRRATTFDHESVCLLVWPCVVTVVLATASGSACSASSPRSCQDNSQQIGGLALIQSANLITQVSDSALQSSDSSSDGHKIFTAGDTSWAATPSTFCSKDFTATVYPARTIRTLDQCKDDCLSDNNCVAITHADMTGIVDEGGPDTCFLCVGTETNEWPSWSTTYILASGDADATETDEQSDAISGHDSTDDVADDGTDAADQSDDTSGDASVDDVADDGTDGADQSVCQAASSSLSAAFDNVCREKCNGERCGSQCAKLCTEACACFKNGSWSAYQPPPETGTGPNTVDGKPTPTRPPPTVDDMTAEEPTSSTSQSSSKRCLNRKRENNQFSVGWCRKNCELKNKKKCHKHCKPRCTSACSCNE